MDQAPSLPSSAGEEATEVAATGSLLARDRVHGCGTVEPRSVDGSPELKERAGQVGVISTRAALLEKRVALSFTLLAGRVCERW